MAFDKRTKKECQDVLADPNSSDAERASAEARIKSIDEYWAKKKSGDSQQKPQSSSYNKAPRADVPRVDYGEIPADVAEIMEKRKGALKAYISAAAQVVDDLQPGIDNRTRGAAVSAATEQLIQLSKIEALKALVK